MKSRTFAGIIAIAVASLLCALSLFVPVNYGRTVRAVEKDLSFGLKNGNFNEVVDSFGTLLFPNWGGLDNIMQPTSVPSGIKEEYVENDYCIKIDVEAAVDSKQTLYYLQDGVDDGHLQLEKGVDYKAGIKAYLTKGGSAKISVKIAYGYGGVNETFAESIYELSSETELLWNDCSVEYKSKEGERAKIVVEVSEVSGTVYLDDAYFIRVNPLLTESGAYFKLSTQSAGLRFFGRADKAYVDALKANSDITELYFGILITTEEVAKSITSFTVSELDYTLSPYILMTANETYNTATAETDGYYGFGCALIDIKESNLKRRFAVRTFLHYKYRYDEYYEYGDFSEENNVRAFSEVIARAAEDTAALSENAASVIEYYVDFLNKF